MQLHLQSPTKASKHFKDCRYNHEEERFTMTCVFCLKVLTDNKNSTGRVSHLRSCRPNLKLTNKVRGQAVTDTIKIRMNSEHDSSDGTDVDATPKK